jgi:hypothetical protein
MLFLLLLILVIVVLISIFYFIFLFILMMLRIWSNITSWIVVALFIVKELLLLLLWRLRSHDFLSLILENALRLQAHLLLTLIVGIKWISTI